MERFRKLKSLGRGQHGEVWLVEREDASLAAMKEVYIDDESSVNLEVSALEKLEHPHIIKYHESFISGGYLHIIIDYAEGGDISSRIRIAKSNGYKFPEAQIWKWFMQICIALNYIHENKIIHRDLKTQNIFLAKNGDIKIGDFGICRVLSKSDELASTSVGTPYYIAPEVCKGQPYNYKADVWSLGCIIYELCSLRRPFEGESIATVLNNILNKTPELLPEEYSDLLTTSVFLMLTKDPAERPSISKILTLANTHSFTEKKDNLSKSRKTYQKEISIKIPTPTNAPIPKNPSSAPNNIIESPSIDPPNKVNAGALTNRSNSYFNFSESLLKQCPSSPIRPMLMGDFLKRRLGDQIFERIKRVINNSKDPMKLLHEEPWIFSDICGEDNLSVIDVAIACGAFSMKDKPIFPNSGSHKTKKTRAFPMLCRKASQ
jgi:NIMA (never in mitosis gene a)-related kinase 1/4/5